MKRFMTVILTIAACYLIYALFHHEHEWIPATCLNPTLCIECGETIGEPHEHNWKVATCSEPKQCADCGKLSENISTLDHKWITITDSKPRKCVACGEIEPMALPKNGTIFIGKDLKRESQLTIKCTSDESCYVKMKNSVGNDVFAFFVRAGSEVTLDVPTGHFYVYFAQGKEWYGTEILFGDETTTYSKDDDLLDFENYSYTYTLYTVANGNFIETPIDEEEFKGN